MYDRNKFKIYSRLPVPGKCGCPERSSYAGLFNDIIIHMFPEEFIQRISSQEYIDTRLPSEGLGGAVACKHQDQSCKVEQTSAEFGTCSVVQKWILSLIQANIYSRSPFSFRMLLSPGGFGHVPRTGFSANSRTGR